MQAAHSKNNRRRHDRKQGVLPVRVRGTDVHGAIFDELAYTLDLTAGGARVGGIRREIKTLEKLSVVYRQRRTDFTVIWTRQLDGKNEFQVGLAACSREPELWGLTAKPGLSSSAVSGSN